MWSIVNVITKPNSAFNPLTGKTTSLANVRTNISTVLYIQCQTCIWICGYHIRTTYLKFCTLLLLLYNVLAFSFGSKRTRQDERRRPRKPKAFSLHLILKMPSYTSVFLWFRVARQFVMLKLFIRWQTTMMFPVNVRVIWWKHVLLMHQNSRFEVLDNEQSDTKLRHDIF